MWVTDPDAIDTVIALNELQPGDGIRLTEDVHVLEAFNIPPRLAGTEHIVKILPSAYRVRLWGSVAITASDWEVGRKQIVAWRRPC